jgi:hypothetical protein
LATPALTELNLIWTVPVVAAFGFGLMLGVMLLGLLEALLFLGARFALAFLQGVVPGGLQPRQSEQTRDDAQRG